MPEKIRLILLIILIMTPSLFSQEIATEESQSEQSLYERTIYNDIKTASYYELLNWCRDLDLDDKGNTDSLKNLLYSFYNIDLNAQESNTSESGTIIKIVSADSSEYYSVEEVDEDYVRISGRVKLIVKQPAKNITHTIEADSVHFNQTTNSMTAMGNIQYLKEENGNEEKYSGDNFTFNVQSWKGVILKGDFKKNQEVNNQDMEFIFSGSAIKKGEGDVVVLDGGSISSCDSDEKHYQIKAKKIWILGPDEWAILSGFFYIGHVPIIYIPFYHLPGNDMFFNPAIGTDTRSGYFIQTTTYLLGKKESSEEDDSFFPNIADSDESYKLVPQGLYLFKEKGEAEQKSDNFIKYKLDYYSRLGGYTALEGSIDKLWEFKSISFDLGIAVSKSIKAPQSGVNEFYSNYFEENDYNAQWNSSNTFGLELPFRWGLDFNFTLLNFTLKFNYMTDPWFKSDYSSREENFDWLNYVLAQTTFEEDEEAGSDSSLDWSLAGNLNIPNAWADNYINSFSFNSVKLSIKWNKKENYSSSYKEENTPDAPLPGEPEFNESNFTDLKPYDPGREFFYPESMNLPQMRLNLSGVLLDYSTINKIPLSRNEAADRGEMRSPWDEDGINENGESDNKSDNAYKTEKFGDIPVTDKYEAFSSNIKYSYSGYINFIAYTESNEWMQPEDIDFGIDMSTFTNTNTVNLNYSLNFFDQIISLSGINTFKGDYADYTGDYSDSDALSEKKSNRIKWNNDLTLSLLPFKKIDYINTSSVKYVFTSDLFMREYNEDLEKYEDIWVDWDEEFITSHSASLNLNFSVPIITAGVSFNTSLPPLDIEQTISPTLTTSFFNWTNTATLKILYNDKDDDDIEDNNKYEWKLDPLTYTSTFKPLDQITLSESLTYNFEDETLTNSTSTLKLWGLNASFTMAYIPDLEWDKETARLITNDKAFIPSNVSAGYTYEYDSPLIWKNRLKMGFSVNTNFNMNLQQYNVSSLSFSFKYNINIHEFLDLNFSMKSSNDYMFLYFPTLRDYYGITDEYSFFTDLFKSFNVFSENQQDRKDSFFNMNTIDVSLVHKLHDWDLEVNYSGKPLIEANTEGGSDTKWDSTLSILVRWNPIEKLKVKADYAEEEWQVDTEFE